MLTGRVGTLLDNTVKIGVSQAVQSTPAALHYDHRNSFHCSSLSRHIATCTPHIHCRHILPCGIDEGKIFRDRIHAPIGVLQLEIMLPLFTSFLFNFTFGCTQSIFYFHSLDTLPSSILDSLFTAVFPVHFENANFLHWSEVFVHWSYCLM